MSEIETLNAPLLQACGISKIYSQGTMSVGLHRFSAEFWRGEFVAITGSSGSGKSTLLNLLSGLDSYDEGELYFMGEPTSHYTEEDRAAYRKDNVAFIFQDYYLLDSYTVYQNIELALLYSMPDPKQRDERVRELMQAVGLEQHAKQRCSQLSGGQKQRVSIARALAKDAPILFADEPCGNLDSAMTEDVMRLLYELSHDKLVLIVTHSFDDVAPYVTRKIRLADGECVEDQVIKPVRLPNEQTTANSITRKQFAKGLVHVASNNIKSTPKRSFFGIAGLAVLTVIFILVLLTVFNAAKGNMFTDGNYRYDLQVNSKTPDTPINDRQMAEIEGIKGVLRAYRYNNLFGTSCSYIVRNNYMVADIRPAINCNDPLYEGRKPTADGEILLAVPGARKYYSETWVGKKLDVTINTGIDANLYTYSFTKEYTVVGVIVSGDEPICYLYDDEFADPKYFYNEELTEKGERMLIVTVDNNANISEIRSTLNKKGYMAMHLYEKKSTMDEISAIGRYSTIVMMLLIIMVCYRFTAGSYRALESIKRRDYNIMRTVGLPNNFIKAIYYVEMVLQALVAWVCGTVLSVIIGLIYGFVVTPNLAYGFKLIGAYASNLWWIVLLSLVTNIWVTIHNALRFNRYFYRQTVKSSLQGGADRD